MRKMSKKIIVSVLTLVLTVVALGTTTYAWFTVGGTVATEEFEMDVTSGIGLEVAYMPTGTTVPTNPKLNYVKTISQKSLLSHLYIDYVLDGNVDEIENISTSTYDDLWKAYFEMDAFTTTDGRQMQTINETTDEEGNANVNLVNAAKTQGFVEFKLAFRTKQGLTSEEALPLILNQIGLRSNGVLFTTPTPYMTKAGSIHNPNDDPLQISATNATRISFADENNEALTTVYEKAESELNTYLGTNTFGWGYGAHDFYKNQTQTDLEEIFEEHEVMTTKTIASLNEDTIATFAQRNGEEAYRYAVITIRIWLEGFDAETFNAIFDDKLFFRFGFNIVIE